MNKTTAIIPYALYTQQFSMLDMLLLFHFTYLDNTATDSNETLEKQYHATSLEITKTLQRLAKQKYLTINYSGDKRTIKPTEKGITQWII